MPASVEALGILLLLLPGFACALILQSIAIRVKQTELEKIIEALVLSFVLYLVTLPFFGYTLPVSWTVSHDGSFANYVIRLHWRHLLALGGGAVGRDSFARGLLSREPGIEPRDRFLDPRP